MAPTSFHSNSIELAIKLSFRWGVYQSSIKLTAKVMKNNSLRKIWLLLSEVTPPYPITFDQNLLETSWVVNTCKIVRVIDSDQLFCDPKSLKIQYGRSRHLGAILAPFTAPKNFLNYPTHFVFQKPFRHVSVIFCIFCGSRDIRKVISLRPAYNFLWFSCFFGNYLVRLWANGKR